VHGTPQGHRKCRNLRRSVGPEELREEAHALKGAGATLGAVRLAALCAALERSGQEGDLEQAHHLLPELAEASAATRIGLEEHLEARRPALRSGT
jgi:two-component system sensor histidine kinase/response regulator